MVAAVLIARAELRHRWKALVAVGVLAGCVAAVVLGAAIGMRRTDTAFDRLVERTGYWDVEVTYPRARTFSEDLTALPDVTSAWAGSLSVGLVQDVGVYLPLAIESGGPRPAGHYDPIVLRGRMFDDGAPDEVVVSELTAEALALDVGDTLAWHAISQGQMDAFSEGEPPGDPGGPQVDLRVVGVVRDPLDVLPLSTLRLLTSPAFHDQVVPEAGGVEHLTVQLAGGSASVDRFIAAARDQGGPEADARSVHRERGSVDRATQVSLSTLLAFTVAALGAGGIALYQALARDLQASADSRPVHRALGLGPGEQLLAILLPRTLVVAVAAAVGVVGAVAGSGLSPVGVARNIAPNPGLEVNAALLLLGAVGSVIVVAALTTLAAIAALPRRERGTGSASARPSQVVARLATAGASVPLVAGAHLALEARSGRAAVPTRSSLAGVVLGLTGVVGALAMVSSLDRLTGSSDRFGWSYDLVVANTDDGDIDRFLADDRIGGVAAAQVANIEVAGRVVPVNASEVRKGSVEDVLTEGRAPVGPDEIALGPGLADDLGLGLDDSVEVQGKRLRVVGLFLATEVTFYASSALMSVEGLEGLASERATTEAHLAYAPGVGEELALEIGRTAEVLTPDTPAEITNLDQGRGPILLFGGFLALLSLAALTHALAVAARRRRGELAVLRSLGCTGAQVRSALRWMATVLAVAGLLVGLPVGMALGGLVWSAMARSVHVAGDTAVPAAALAGVALAAATLGITTATLLGLRSTRITPAAALRTE